MQRPIFKTVCHSPQCWNSLLHPGNSFSCLSVRVTNAIYADRSCTQNCIIFCLAVKILFITHCLCPSPLDVPEHLSIEIKENK